MKKKLLLAIAMVALMLSTVPVKAQEAQWYEKYVLTPEELPDGWEVKVWYPFPIPMIPDRLCGGCGTANMDRPRCQAQQTSKWKEVCALRKKLYGVEYRHKETKHYNRCVVIQLEDSTSTLAYLNLLKELLYDIEIKEVEFSNRQADKIFQKELSGWKALTESERENCRKHRSRCPYHPIQNVTNFISAVPKGVRWGDEGSFYVDHRYIHWITDHVFPEQSETYFTNSSMWYVLKYDDTIVVFEAWSELPKAEVEEIINVLHKKVSSEVKGKPMKVTYDTFDAQGRPEGYFAKGEPIEIAGDVTSEGKGISGATVWIEPLFDSIGMFDPATLSTDTSGHYSYTFVPSFKDAYCFWCSYAFAVKASKPGYLEAKAFTTGFRLGAELTNKSRGNYFKAIKGLVLVKKGGGEWKYVPVGTEGSLDSIGDGVMTKRRSKAIVYTVRGGKIRKKFTLKQLSQLEISRKRSEEERPAWLELLLLFTPSGLIPGSKSSVWVGIDKLSPEEILDIQTPGAVVGIKGTELTLDITEDGTTSLHVFEGICDFYDLEERKTVVVHAGETSKCQAGGVPTDPVPYRDDDRDRYPDGMERWWEEEEREEEEEEEEVDITKTSLIAEDRTVPPGETVSVPIRLEKAEHIGSLGFNLSYDPAVAQVVNVSKGSIMDPAVFSYNDKETGIIRFGFASATGVSGEKDAAAVIEFKAIGAEGSKSPLTLSEILPTDAEGAPLSINLVDGELTIEKHVIGDCNRDNKITVVDALCALQMYVGLRDVDLIMDMDEDGRVTTEDARRILIMAKR